MTAAIERHLLLDTHIWIWTLEGSPRLPTAFREAISDAHTVCWLSPISIWELGILVRKNKIAIDMDLRGWVDKALRVFPLRETGLSREIALLANEVDLPHRDPADRMLVATALALDLTLATVDGDLISSPQVPTLELDEVG